MQKISSMLWFDTQAEDAAKFYTAIFDDSEITATAYYPEGTPGQAGTVMTVAFKLFDQEFVGLNGGPLFKFTEAISFVVKCETQAEIDRYWSALTEGGSEVQCGWLKDKFGLSWQIVPTAMERLSKDGDPEKSARMFRAMMGMVKLDITALQRAYDGE